MEKRTRDLVIRMMLLVSQTAENGEIYTTRSWIYGMAVELYFYQ